MTAETSGDGAVNESPATAAYREKVAASATALEQKIAELGGRRDGPAVPTPKELAKVESARAARLEKAGQLSDEELGLGELGIPERRVRGTGAAHNFTLGPVFIYEGPRSIGAIAKLGDPVVLVARYIPDHELKKIDKTRVRGFVIEQGSMVDPTFWIYFDENRAAIVGAEGALELAVNGEQAIVDGVRGAAYFGPSPLTIKDYTYLRMIGPPPDDPLLREGLRALTGPVMGTMIRLGEQPPFDFPEEPRLLDVAKRVRLGVPLTEEDDAWMKGIILKGMPTPMEQLR